MRTAHTNVAPATQFRLGNSSCGYCSCAGAVSLPLTRVRKGLAPRTGADVGRHAPAAPQTIEQAVRLLKAPPPWRRPLEPVYEGLAAIKGPRDWPAPDSEIEDLIFAASA
jgi:hypothetical protein